MRHVSLFVLVVGLAIVASAVPARGQFNRNSTSSGSGRNASSQASNRFGASRFGQELKNRAGGTTGDVSRSARGANNFVGADSSDVRNLTGFVESMRNLSRGNLGRGNSRTGVNSGGRGGGRGAAEVRSSLRVAFGHSRATSTDMASQLTARIHKSLRTRPESAVGVSFTSGKATLRGSVATEHDRALTERLIRLEPGVRQVENLLTVAAPATIPPPQAGPENRPTPLAPEG